MTTNTERNYLVGLKSDNDEDDNYSLKEYTEDVENKPLGLTYDLEGSELPETEEENKKPKSDAASEYQDDVDYAVDETKGSNHEEEFSFYETPLRNSKGNPIFDEILTPTRKTEKYNLDQDEETTENFVKRRIAEEKEKQLKKLRKEEEENSE
jgi:hypothetical protein